MVVLERFFWRLPADSVGIPGEIPSGWEKGMIHEPSGQKKLLGERG